MPVPGLNREILMSLRRREAKAEQPPQEYVPAGTEPPAMGQAQGVYRQSPWGTRITSPRGSNGGGFPYYDMDEHGIPVPPEGMSEAEMFDYINNLREVSPPVPAGQLRSPWTDAIGAADQQLLQMLMSHHGLTQKQALQQLDDYRRQGLTANGLIPGRGGNR